MFRFVVSPDRAVIPDLAGKLPGRGIWLSARGDVIQASGAKGRELVRAIARNARGPVSLPPDLSVILEAALIRRIGDFLGLARRAGQAIAGFEKARDWMKTHPTGAVLQARDGSEAERARFRSGVPDTVPVLAPLTGAELGRVFGHDHVVHVALAPGRLAGAIVTETGRLSGLRTFREDGPGQPRGDARDKPRGDARDKPRGDARNEPRGDARDKPREAVQTPSSHRAAERETAGTNDVTGING